MPKTFLDLMEEAQKYIIIETLHFIRDTLYQREY